MLDKFKGLMGKKEAPVEEGLTEEEEAAADAAADAVVASPSGPSWFDRLRGPKPEDTKPKGPTWVDRLKSSLSRTRQNLVGQMRALLGRGIDDNFWDDLEAILLAADVGTTATDRILADLKKLVKEKRITDTEVLLGALRDDLSAVLAQSAGTLNRQEGGPTVVMVVGVNGTGKTTTIAKLAWHLKEQGLKVMLGAADTFRAAAIDQLQIWAERVQIECIRTKEGADPAAVAFDAVGAAKARGADVLIIDTAGRLHSQVNLMEELKKIWRVVGQQLPGAPHECLLVLDASTGQNALSQARTFRQAVGVSGIVMSKMDGSAKGGILIALAQDLNIPIKYIGIGEKMDDLREFNPQEFVEALFATT